MLSKLRVQHYKSLFDTEVDLEPLTVFIGPNGSGKSNICESLAVLSDFLHRSIENQIWTIRDFLVKSLQSASKSPGNIESKFWHGKSDYLSFEVKSSTSIENDLNIKEQIILDLSVYLDYNQNTVSIKTRKKTGTYGDTKSHSEFLASIIYSDSPIAACLKKVKIYDFTPTALSSDIPTNEMDRIGQGIAYSLVDILHSSRESFDELEERLTQLVPNIKRILMPRDKRAFSLALMDRYSEHPIPASDISDGTLRILAFLTALYQENTPSIICFEEIENGVHPWLLHKMMELLKIVSTEGISGNPVQVLITTHSPVLLNYVEPHQVRAVELDNEGKTQVHALPTDSVRFKKALEAYDGSLGELWFTDVFGGNPV
jgi:predicted ATPase